MYDMKTQIKLLIAINYLLCTFN